MDTSPLKKISKKLPKKLIKKNKNLRKCPWCNYPPDYVEAGELTIIACKNKHCFVKPQLQLPVGKPMAEFRWNMPPKTLRKYTEIKQKEFKRDQDWKQKVTKLK